MKEFFDTKTNRIILKEAVKNRFNFHSATTFKGLDLKMRTNLVAYYDEIYKSDRKKSLLLTKIDETFHENPEFTEILESSPYPIHQFTRTDYHETQVSRYGKDNQYKFHIDSGGMLPRTISIVYYFNSEPKKWSGGELELTDSPIHQGNVIDGNADIKEIMPENNMLIVFGGYSAHRVKPTISPKKFEDGRFSVNCWVGFK